MHIFGGKSVTVAEKNARRIKNGGRKKTYRINSPVLLSRRRLLG